MIKTEQTIWCSLKLCCHLLFIQNERKKAKSKNKKSLKFKKLTNEENADRIEDHFKGKTIVVALKTAEIIKFKFFLNFFLIFTGKLRKTYFLVCGYFISLFVFLLYFPALKPVDRIFRKIHGHSSAMDWIPLFSKLF